MSLPDSATVLRAFTGSDESQPLLKAAQDLFKVWHAHHRNSPNTSNSRDVQPADLVAPLVWFIDNEVLNTVADTIRAPDRDAPLAGRTYGQLISSLAQLYASLEEAHGHPCYATLDFEACKLHLDSLAADIQAGRVRLPPPDLDRS